MTTYFVTLMSKKEMRAPNGICYDYRVIAENPQDALDKVIAVSKLLGNIKYHNVIEDKNTISLLSSYRL